MDKSYEDPYSATDALGQAEAVLETDPERARLLLHWVADNQYGYREPFFDDWRRARGLARELVFRVVDQPEALAQTFSIISRLDSRLGDHRSAFLTSMYAFQQQTLAFNRLKETWSAMPDEEVNTRFEGMRSWAKLVDLRREGGLTEEEVVEQHKLEKQMAEVPGSTSLMVALFDDSKFPQESTARAQDVRNFVVSTEASSVFGAAKDVLYRLDHVKLTKTDHHLLESMSSVLLTTGPIPVRESSLGWSSSARDMAKIIYDLYWKLALKSALTPRQASKYAKIANGANRVYHQLARPSLGLEEFAKQRANLCIGDLLESGRNLA